MRINRANLILSLVAVAVAISSIVIAQPGRPDNPGKHLGPPGGTIYAHDRMFRTIGTPAILPNHGKFDTIYVLGEPYANVADAAPGDMNFNGGRWEVRPIDWKSTTRMQFTNAEDIKAAAMAGDIAIGDVVKRFECPLIPK